MHEWGDPLGYTISQKGTFAMQKTTGELLDLLKKSPTASTYMEQAADNLIHQIPLSEYLTKLIEEKNLTPDLDKGYVYDILAGKKNPSRDKVLALCFAMSLSADEVQKLLKSTGYAPLYVRMERDSILLFGLEHGLSVMEVNELLYEMRHELLE